jgi:putative tryptophan/tyrosine transport system substrate-binding protein
MRRREFIAGLGSAVALPVTAGGQPAAAVVGFLAGATRAEYSDIIAESLKGLQETGHVEGQNMGIQYRWAEGRYERLAGLASDLLGRRVGLIVTFDTASAVTAKAATTTIPIVFANGADPIKLGLVTNLSRPGGNVTGVSHLVNALSSKRLDLLHALAPSATAIGFLIDPTNPNAELETADMRTAAGLLGLRLVVASASTASEVETAIANLVQQRIEALAVAAHAYFIGRTPKIAELALRHRFPTIYGFSQSAEAGGLMSYGGLQIEAYRQAGIYAGRILNGEKVSALPVQLVTRFEMVVNLKAASALGLTIPETLLATADEVIQ